MTTAIVTGGSNGFGAAIAIRLARDGANVMVVDIDGEKANRVAQLINRQDCFASAYSCDVGDGDAFLAMVERTQDKLGCCDIIVNNAGYTHERSAMENVEPEDFNRVFSVNVKSIYWTGRFIVPRMKKRCTRGAIINISSTAGIRPGMALTWYSASKAAVDAATRGMAMELAEYGIRVNSIAPGLGDTGLLTRFSGEKDSTKARQQFGGSIPLGRLCQPDDVANAASFLAGPDAAFITGHCLHVDGGFLAGNFSSSARTNTPRD